jgi:hypothetical protein
VGEQLCHLCGEKVTAQSADQDAPARSSRYRRESLFSCRRSSIIARASSASCSRSFSPAAASRVEIDGRSSRLDADDPAQLDVSSSTPCALPPDRVTVDAD